MAGTLPQHQVPGEPDPRLLVAPVETIQVPVERPEHLVTDATLGAAQTNGLTKKQPTTDPASQTTQANPEAETTAQIHEAVTSIEATSKSAAVSPDELLDLLERSTESGTVAQAGEQVENVITF